MNRLIYFDNLRSLSIILTLAALLLPLGTVFYEGSTTIAIAVIFFISAYFGASKLRIRTITFFLKIDGTAWACPSSYWFSLVLKKK